MISGSIILVVLVFIEFAIILLQKKENDKNNKLIKKYRGLSDKHLMLFFTSLQWIKYKQKEKKISEYLLDKGYRKILIYGMSYLGNTLEEELKNTEVQVMYGIDKGKDLPYTELDVFNNYQINKDADAVIVTAIAYYDEIKETLEKEVDIPILSLEKILLEV